MKLHEIPELLSGKDLDLVLLGIQKHKNPIAVNLIRGTWAPAEGEECFAFHGGYLSEYVAFEIVLQGPGLSPRYLFPQWEDYLSHPENEEVFPFLFEENWSDFFTLEVMKDGYVEAWHWADLEELWQRDNGSDSQPDMGDSIHSYAGFQCDKFVTFARWSDLELWEHEEGINWSNLGHTLYLTEMGHGSTFEDKDGDIEAHKRMCLLADNRTQHLEVWVDNKEWTWEVTPFSDHPLIRC